MSKCGFLYRPSLSHYRYHTDDLAVKAQNPLWVCVCVNAASSLQDIGRKIRQGGLSKKNGLRS